MQSKKAFHRRICVLIAPDANEGGPCILQMYKGKLGDKPKAIMSIRDCHAVTKLGAPCFAAVFAPRAVVTASSAFCLLILGGTQPFPAARCEI